MTTLFRHCLLCSNQHWNRQLWCDLVQCCKLQRWRTQRFLYVGFTLSDVAKSYQPKNNVETTLILDKQCKITKQMFQRLPIALAQVKVGNTSKKVLNEIRQIIYYLYRAKEITKKVYNNIMNSISIK